jgi:5'-3' exonuclease
VKYAIVDVANLFHRARHATRGDAFTKIGMTMHIVFSGLKRLHLEHRCDHVVFCLEGRSWRYDVYPQYKSKRKLDRAKKMVTLKDREEEEVFNESMDTFAEYIREKTRCTVLQSNRVEGDDFIARWTQLHPNDDHVIFSSDSDFIQLLAPNVSIYDGMAERYITTEAVYDSRGRECVFEITPSKGSVKVGKPIPEAEKDHVREEKKKAKLKESYEPQPFSFEPEPEWWRKALFIKTIRGDASDSIFSAYPGVRFKGSSKKVGINEAWADRNSMGYDWNNFMLQTWDKYTGTDEKGNDLHERVRVMDEYACNRMLIDLTQQPQEIKDHMDAVIIEAVQKEKVGNVGIGFLRFCADFELNRLSKDATDHATYLNAPYSRG